jgi:hypothetical protein
MVGQYQNAAPLRVAQAHPMRRTCMRTQILAALFLSAAFFALPTAILAQGNLGCVGATNHLASGYRDGYGGMVSRTDQASVRERSFLGLPTIPNAQVTIVSDTTICRIASAAYDSAVSFPAASEAPLVVKIGTTLYAVIKGIDSHSGRFNVLFNQDFTIARKTIWY